VTTYPAISEYNQSAQHPSTAFTDPELAAGTLATSGLGLPIVLGGGFALTYTVASKARKFAVRCFHRYVPDLKQRYAEISDVVAGLGSEHFVSFEYQREGVRVRSGLYPVVKMAWAEGATLGAYIEDNYDDGAAMRSLWSAFRDLERFLADRNIAHGDLENGNLVVRDDGGLTLIDYDGMYVPGMALGNGNELGHAHFQHPGRTPDHFGPRMDDFSFILIDISLDAVARDPSLYERFCNGDNILFQKSDFEDPGTSAVFKELRGIRPLTDKLDDFASICKRPIEQVPSLEAFVARHAKTRSSAAGATPRGIPARSKPDGMSNLDYIKSTLGKGTQGGKSTTGPTPSPLQLAVSNVAASPTATPLSDRIAGWASALPIADNGSWLWRGQVFLVALVLLAILISL
jgi:hypothetical protein